MASEPSDLRQRLLEAQDMTPELRAAYQKELAAMLQYTASRRTRLLLSVLLLVMLVFIAVGVRALLFYRAGPLLFAIWAVFTGICAAAALWIVAFLWRGRFLWRSYFPVADVFTVAATVITVLSLVAGLRAPSDPASTFGVLYALALLVICTAWSLHNRIASAELAVREQMLRIECRLADLASQRRE